MSTPKGYRSDITEPILDWQPAEWEVPDERNLRLMTQKDKHTGLLTKAAYRARIQWARENRWLLVRNVHQHGESGKLHAGEYLTLAGVERPFRGTDPLLFVIQKATGSNSQRLNLEVFERLFELGAIEPITNAKAAELWAMINIRRRSPEHIMDRMSRKRRRGRTLQNVRH